MLFKRPIIQLIRAGKVKIAFRKWVRPTVKSGGSLLTPAGLLRIQSVEKIAYSTISKSNIMKAGYSNRYEFDQALPLKRPGDIYRIRFIREEDPRLGLRDNVHFSEEEVRTLEAKLNRLDSASPYGPWTRKALQLLSRRPNELAKVYAAALNVDKDWFKLNVRKLKNLGLTIGYPQGYDISPRGEELLRLINR
jgi:hypothetical protein